jgi:hypothetical protein
VGLPLNWLVGPSSRPISDPSFASVAFTPTGQGWVPFAPSIADDPSSYGRATGDYLIKWYRRDRSLASNNWTPGIPNSDMPMAFEVDVYVAGDVVRTLEADTTSVTYTVAMQTTDLGALLDVGDTLDIRIYQISERMGRGIPLIWTLQF